MTLLPEEVGELCEWFADLHDGDPAPAEWSRVEARLQADPAARRLYLRYMRVCAGLSWDLRELAADETTSGAAASRPGATGSAAPQADQPPRAPVLGFLGSVWQGMQASPRTLLVILAALLAGYFVVMMALIPLAHLAESNRLAQHGHLDGDVPSRSVDSVGTLQPHGQAKWSHATPESIGSATQVGHRYELLSGRVNIVLARGTHLAIEGPAVWQFASDQRLQLDAGRVAARVPPAAIGFTVVTPTAEVVDLGTRFVVDVTSADETKVAVTQGAVTLRTLSGTAEKPVQIDGASIQVAAGQTIKVSRISAVDVVARSASFDAGWTRQAVLLDEVIDQIQDQANSPAVISINLAGADGAESLAATDLAGVVSVGHWNSLTTVNGNAWRIVDNSGAPTRVTIATQNFAGQFQFSQYATPGMGDGTMMSYGWYIRSDSNLAVIDVADIPYAAYDVYVYSNQNANGRLSHFTIGSTTIPLTSVGIYSPFPPYQQTTAESSAGNYIHFSGLTGPSFSLSVQGLSGDVSLNQSAISGLQIVQVSPAARPSADE